MLFDIYFFLLTISNDVRMTSFQSLWFVIVMTPLLPHSRL